VRRSVYCTASFSICSRRRTKFPIISRSSARLQSRNLPHKMSTSSCSIRSFFRCSVRNGSESVEERMFWIKGSTGLLRETIEEPDHASE
jgi:hypothetical protein